MKNEKMKLALIGNAYWVEMNREKAISLSKWYDVTVITHESKGHHLMGRDMSDIEGDGDTSTLYSLHLLQTSGNNQGGTKFTLIGLSKIIKQLRPDIILIETEPWARIYWQTVWAKIRHSKQAKIGLFSWENIKRPGLKGRILSLFYKQAVRTLDFIIAGNEDAKKIFLSEGMKEKNIHVDAQIGFSKSLIPPHASNIRASLRNTWKTDTDTIVIGFCGRFVEEKGVYDLFEAVRCLKNETLLPPLELHYLGGGPLEGELEKLSSQYAWFKIHDPIPHDKVVGLMTAWDIFVLPSKRLDEGGDLWEEQFGHVLLNAMGAGCVTIGSNSGAIPEVLDHDNDVIFLENNITSLKSVLQKFIFDKKSWQNKITKQTARAHEHYSFAEIAERYHAHITQHTKRK